MIKYIGLGLFLVFLTFLAPMMWIFFAGCVTLVYIILSPILKARRNEGK